MPDGLLAQAALTKFRDILLNHVVGDLVERIALELRLQILLHIAAVARNGGRPRLSLMDVEPTIKIVREGHFRPHKTTAHALRAEEPILLGIAPRSPRGGYADAWATWDGYGGVAAVGEPILCAPIFSGRCLGGYEFLH